ncbi:MAG: hypothetical protein LUD15_09440 [Bacteroides sp.]|nr:hypothetical protein [Bacteroides sp.]
MKKEEIDKLLTQRIKEILTTQEIPHLATQEFTGMNITILQTVIPSRTQFIPNPGSEEGNLSGYLEVTLEKTTITCVIEHNICTQAAIFRHTEEEEPDILPSTLTEEISHYMSREEIVRYLPGRDLSEKEEEPISIFR